MDWQATTIVHVSAGKSVEEMFHGLSGRYCCSCISRVRVLRRCSMDWQAATVVHVSAGSGC